MILHARLGLEAAGAGGGFPTKEPAIRVALVAGVVAGFGSTAMGRCEEQEVGHGRFL